MGPSRRLKAFALAASAVALVVCSGTEEARSRTSPADSAPGDGSPRTSLLKQVAERPPMGWNSFDAWDSRIDEETYRKTVDFLAEHLKRHGWEYAVIDYIWWNPDPGGYNTRDNYIRRPGHANLRLNPDGSLKYPQAVTMDGYGRLLPAVHRFPSSADGKGFGPLADYVHGKGLKFGIHIMRGIHRHAYYEDTPILGTDRTARDIAKVGDQASWLNNMFGVDDRNEGAQAYYDSIFALYAGWGVDYVKADDMMGSCGAPFYGYSAGEIEMMRSAIDHSGRPMVLSLSCGEAPIARANHLERHANMWRVSTDFWDEWEDLRRSFQLLDRWSSFIGDHTWPDADMIPFGHLSIDGRPHGPDRMSRLTRPEHYSLMTLFSIARSPLMIGADLLSTPFETIETFFTNDEVLHVNRHSAHNRQVVRVDSETSDTVGEHHAVWIADDPETGDLFVALFNLSDENKAVTFDFQMEDLRGAYRVRDLWAREDIGEVERELTAELDAHGAGLYRLSRLPGSSDAWVPPNPAEARGVQ
jgi:alpha-galactosidase